MELPDIVNIDKKYYDFLRKIGIGEIYILEGNFLKRADKESFPFKVATFDFEKTIRRNRANAIAFWEKYNFKLDKGLAEKMKENDIFIIFDLRNIKNNEFLPLLINNAYIANDYGVNAIFATFCEKEDEILSAYQIMSIAETLGYRYNNLRRSYKRLLEIS
ncbi:MAG: hypothetical protein QXJ93_02480 [Candidatus Rehaiarchaeum fermentans]|nr:hypothetical protein [Candidatus Rehaiarchaeum fermentans]